MRKSWLAFVLVAFLTFTAAESDTLNVYFIDVGQGDAILVDYGDWECLIDAGKGTSSSSLELLSVLECAVTDGTIELAVLSHNHWDHYGGFADLIESSGYVISTFWTSEDPNADTEKTRWLEFSTAFNSAEFVKEKLAAGSIPLVYIPSDLEWAVLGPAEIRTTKRNDNENSLVLLLTFGAVRVLFTGDIQTEGAKALAELDLGEGPLVLKVPHHGAKNASAIFEIAGVVPTVSVISAGDDNRYGHPDADLVDALARFGPVFITTCGCSEDCFAAGTTSLANPDLAIHSNTGTIHIETDGECVWITTDTLSRQVLDCSNE